MVGPILDLLQARREPNGSAVVVFSRGNRLVTTLVPWHLKLVFWLTNVGYWVLATQLLIGGEVLQVAGARWQHALAALVVASASTAFHGAVLFGGVDSQWPPRLIAADLVAANGYGVALAALCGVSRVLRVFAMPICALFAAARLKRRGAVLSYAALHGLWHVLSALAMWHCLFGGLPGTGWPPAVRAPAR